MLQPSLQCNGVLPLRLNKPSKCIHVLKTRLHVGLAALILAGRNSIVLYVLNPSNIILLRCVLGIRGDHSAIRFHGHCTQMHRCWCLLHWESDVEKKWVLSGQVKVYCISTKILCCTNVLCNSTFTTLVQNYFVVCTNVLCNRIYIALVQLYFVVLMYFATVHLLHS